MKTDQMSLGLSQPDAACAISGGCDAPDRERRLRKFITPAGETRAGDLFEIIDLSDDDQAILDLNASLGIDTTDMRRGMVERQLRNEEIAAQKANDSRITFDEFIDILDEIYLDAQIREYQNLVAESYPAEWTRVPR